MRSFKTFLLLSVVLLSYHSGIHAKTINAANGTTAGIQAAVHQAAAGDTVRIPAGTFNFNGSVSMNAGVTILGAGSNSTILNKTGSSTTAMFVVNGGNGRRVTIGQFTLSGVTGSSSTTQDNGIRINSCTDFHVFDIVFKNFGFSAVYVTGNSRGVIRKCSFIDIFRPAINNLGYGVVIYGDRDGSWNRPLNLGSGDAVYIEDCRFSNNRHAVASNDGAKYVFRYNTVVDNAGNFQSVDAHGREYGSPRGSRSFEVYNNTIDNSVRNAWCSIMIRGGDGVIFNNNLLRGTGSAPILLCNRTDGTHVNASYPAPDQTRSLYVWNNKRGNGSTAGVTVRDGHQRFFQLGRDYFHTEMPGYKPYTYPHPLAGTQAPDIKDDPLPDATDPVVPVDPEPTDPDPIEPSEPTSVIKSLGANSAKPGILARTSEGVLRYNVPETARVRLTVHDMRGRTLAVNFDKVMQAGIHELQMNSRVNNGTKMAAGQYIYRLSIGEETFTVSAPLMRK